jgi:site-specific recombinase XerD
VLEPELRCLQAFGRGPWVFAVRDGAAPGSASVVRHLRRMIHRVAPGRCIHSIRHSFITHLIEEGVPIAVVQRLARHSRLQTTLGYLHIADVQAESELRKRHPWAKNPQDQ